MAERRERAVLWFVVATVAVAALAPVLAPQAPDAIDLAVRRAGPGLAHWFGTDDLGRDVLSRVLHGARVSLSVGLASAAVALAIGATVGLLAGWMGGAMDSALMRLTDAALSVPRLPLLMIAGAIVEPTALTLAVLVGAVGWMETARVVRADVLTLRDRPFIDAARATGAGGVRIVWHHLVPNVAPTIAVSATLAVGRGILLESALSFFGVGVRPPAASWGNMLHQAQQSMSSEPWVAVFPGLCILTTVVLINLLGDRLVAPVREGAVT